jgi:uncharacterized protein (TIGR02147 family)
MNYWQTVIQTDFEARRSRNYAFSLRSYAQYLGLSPAQLSQLLSGKRKLTPKTARKLSLKLNLSPVEREKFELSGLLLKAEEPVNESHIQLVEDEFALISDWYHFAILSLSELKDCKASPLWVARRLGIEHGKAREALERLERLGIVALDGGRIRQLKKNLRTTSDIPSAAIRKYHRQNLQLAAERLETVPPELREFTAITMAMNPENLPEAKRLLNDFKRKLCRLLQTGEPSDVYTFSAQLFPVGPAKDNA